MNSVRACGVSRTVSATSTVAHNRRELVLLPADGNTNANTRSGAHNTPASNRNHFPRPPTPSMSTLMELFLPKIASQQITNDRMSASARRDERVLHTYSRDEYVWSHHSAIGSRPKTERKSHTLLLGKLSIGYRHGCRMGAPPSLGWSRRRPAPLVHKKRCSESITNSGESLRLRPRGENFPTPLNASTVGLACVFPVRFAVGLAYVIAISARLAGLCWLVRVLETPAYTGSNKKSTRIFRRLAQIPNAFLRLQ